MNSAIGFFALFCALLAVRDVVTHFLLSHQTSPLSILVIYCSLSTLYSWVFMWHRTGSPNILAKYNELTKPQKMDFIRLGIYTLAVYLCTVYGISLIGAALFNFVDYGMMPMMMIAMAVVMAGEKPPRRIFVGGIFALIGISVFFLHSSSISWILNLGVLMAILSPIFTSICSALQKRQIDSGLSPDLVLMYRFPIPAVILSAAAMVTHSEFVWRDFPILVLISFAGVFLPLLFLCFGFARSTLSRFSSYLFLIPILTFILGPIVVQGEWERLSNPFVACGILIVLFGFSISEGLWRSFFSRYKRMRVRSQQDRAAQ